MSEINDSQIKELNRVWHSIFVKNLFRTIESKYPNLKSLDNREIGVIARTGHHKNTVIKDVTRESNLPKSSITNVINKLEAKGLILREINPEDKRSFKLVLTSEGEKVLKEHDDFEYELCSTVLAALDSSDERDLFLSLCSKISNNLLDF